MNQVNAGIRSWMMVCITLIAASHSVSAQTSADFTASTLSGCSPIVVSFTDQSTGNPTQWRWDLGNGVISSLQNPATTYFNAGNYTIKLVVRSATGADSIVKSQFIAVYANPVVKFTAPDTAGCLPLNVKFTDLSSTETGTLSSWDWDFGDGTTSTLKSPSHTYTAAGQFSVTLKVTNSTGCVKTLGKAPYILVGKGASTSFTNTNPGHCTPPVTIEFTNTSTGASGLSYSWNFGDGTGSTAENPAHTYTTRGTHSVTLITQTPQGCRDTLRKANLVSIGNIVSNFSVPANICAGMPFTPVNTTTPTPGSVVWSFGDGTRSTETSPVKTYSAPGTYTLKLVNDLGGCRDSISKPVKVMAKPTAAFSADKTASCLFPFSVTFTNKTAGTNTLLWLFGDGTSSTQVNPTHIYNAEGRYTVKLVATNESGCPDTLVMTDYIRIERPVIVVANLPATGCTPLAIAPVATVTANQPIASYRWDFGDGSTSVDAAPKHIYSIAGTYIVKLTITTTGGCAETLVIDNAVRAGDKPDAKFTVSPTEACAFQRVQYTDKSTGKVDQWLWQFGDGNTSQRQNPTYAYRDTAHYTVTLIAWSNTCPDTFAVESAVYSKPPIANFTAGRTCTEKYVKNFVDKSVNAATWNWDFGDGTSSSLQNTPHTYSATGNYTVVLTVTNGSCTHTKRQIVPVVDEKASFVADDTSCRGKPVQFTSIGINPDKISKWQWDFGDGATSSTPSAVSHAYSLPGTYTVRLRITDSQGCPDNQTKEVTIYGPTAGFTNVPSACLYNNNILFTDTSKGDGTHPIIRTIWNYGDGTSEATGRPPYRHVYAKSGVYPVSLAVTDSYGCIDTALRPDAVIIAQPLASFTSPDTSSCIGKPVRFTNASTGIQLQNAWSFGDGSPGESTANPVHAYPRIGLFTVSLKVADKYGCRDSVSRPHYIRISLPKASFKVSDTLSMCPPLLVKFTNFSSNYVTLLWDFGDGNVSVLDTPSHYYTIAGVYYSKLIVTGPGGCTDTMVQKIVVKGPKGFFTYDPVVGCDSVEVNFKATTQDRVSFIWDLGDGTTLFTTDSLIQHKYSPGEYVPKMILIDASGCKVPIVGPNTIKVVTTDPRFTMDALRLCDSGRVSFTNTSTSNDLITNYQWRFGDGGVSDSQHPVHQYTAPGVYTTHLKIITQAGCTDSLELKDTIRVFSSPGITVRGDSAACVPANLTFSAQVLRGNPSLLKWQWDFGNNNVSSLQNPAPQSYGNAGDYTVTTTATDNQGCKAILARTVRIHPLPNIFAGADAGICAGNSLQLQPTGADSYTWNASPFLSCSDCKSPVATPADTTDFIVNGTTSFGCIRADTVRIFIQHPFTLAVSEGDKICAGGSILLSASGADRYSWSPTAGLESPAMANTVARPASTTEYTVTAKDTAGCFTVTGTVRVTVISRPTVVGDDITTAAGTPGQIRIKGSSDITSWKWTPATQLTCADCPEPKAFPKKTTQYEIEVSNASGCINKDSLTVFVTCNNGNLFVPNTFSPNNDGMNDRFFPRGKGIGLIRSLRVFNRWGETVFERRNFNANDASAGWDGTFRGQKLSTNVFVYTCEVVCENSEILQFKGDVTLIQ